MKESFARSIYGISYNMDQQYSEMQKLLGFSIKPIHNQYNEMKKMLGDYFELQKDQSSTLYKVINTYNSIIEPVNDKFVEMSKCWTSVFGSQRDQYSQIQELFNQYNCIIEPDSYRDIVKASSLTKKQVKDLSNLVNNAVVDNKHIFSKENINVFKKEKVFEKFVSNIDEGEKLQVDEAEENEVYDDLETVATSENWQQKFVIVTEKWKTKNPVIWLFLTQILLFFFLTVLSNLTSNALTKGNTIVRAEPKSVASVVLNIEVNQHISILGNAPYYYQIEYMDDSKNEQVKGWVSKRSVIVPSKGNTPNHSNCLEK